jgi:hypothetical protein
LIRSRPPARLTIEPKHVETWSRAGVWCDGTRSLNEAMATQTASDTEPAPEVQREPHPATQGGLMPPRSEPPDAGAAKQAAALEWHKLPELPPHREPYERTRLLGRYRKVTINPTDAVLVRTAANEPQGLRATFHHSRNVFSAFETGERITNVVEWAFAPKPTEEPPPCPSASDSKASTSSSETSG